MREQLAAYAAGATSEGMTLLIASHLTYCPECRRAVAEYEAVSGALFMGEQKDPLVAAPSLEACMTALDADGPAVAEPVAVPHTPLPLPIRHAVGAAIDDLPWKFRMPGLHECTLDGYEGEHVSLMRIRPGVGVFDHTHEGEEATLVLSGAMEDGGTVYRRGDVALNDHNDDHHPKIVGDEVCYCLIVMTGHLRFTGPVSRALNLFTR